MKKINRRTALKTSIATLAATSFSGYRYAHSASYGPADLKNGTLTPFGALRAGNADGSIPEWTGEVPPLPADFVPGNTFLPYPDEKPMYTITAGNYTQYQDKLSAGVIAMLQKYPDFRMDVYPSHRTYAAPQYVYDYIYKNASTAQLSADGNSISNAYGGIPFPIPQNGHEVMWNHLLTWQGVTVNAVGDTHVVTSDGQIVLEARATNQFQFPYYFQDGEARFNGIYEQVTIIPSAPPYQVGNNIVLLQPVDSIITPVEAWSYLPGERRVRRAPELQYDTPISLTGGTTNWDEAGLFYGKLDRYDWNYTGIKEMIVPYNTNKACAAAISDQFGPHFFNPDLVRWELHRCRVVDGTLRPGSRNVDARRVFYCDEDTGAALLGDIYDGSGSLWKHQHSMPTLYPNIPTIVTFIFCVTYDLHAGNYSVENHSDAETYPQWKPTAEYPPSHFTPGSLAASAGGY